MILERTKGLEIGKSGKSMEDHGKAYSGNWSLPWNLGENSWEPWGLTSGKAMGNMRQFHGKNTRMSSRLFYLHIRFPYDSIQWFGGNEKSSVWGTHIPYIFLMKDGEPVGAT